MAQILLATTTNEVSQNAESAQPDRGLLYYVDQNALRIKNNGFMKGLTSSPDNVNIIKNTGDELALSKKISLKSLTVNTQDQAITWGCNVPVFSKNRYLLLLKRNMTTNNCMSGTLIRQGKDVQTILEISASANGDIVINGATTESKKPTTAIVSYNGVEYVAIAFAEAHDCSIYFNGYDGRSPDILPPVAAVYNDAEIKVIG